MKFIKKRLSFGYWVTLFFFLIHFFVLVGVYYFFWRAGQIYLVLPAAEGRVPSYLVGLYWPIHIFFLLCVLFLGYKILRFFRMFIWEK